MSIKNKILITGGAGFIGSNFIKFLLNKGNNEIVVYDNLSTGKLENIQKYIDNNNVKFENIDITEHSIVEKIKLESFDFIYNFACPASPKFYLEHPIDTWKSSVYGVNNLLDSILGTKTRLFHSSTSEVYGDPLVLCQTETYWGNVNPIGVRSCYDEGKRAAESLIFDYIRLYDVDVRVARIFNTYGPNMAGNDGRVISNFIIQALNNDNITIYGDGKQTRSFCYVDDTVNCIYELMNYPERIKTPMNIGNPNEMNIATVAQYIKDKLKSNSVIVNQQAMSDDPKIRCPDIKKAKELLNWEPRISFYDGIDQTIKYFKKELVLMDNKYLISFLGTGHANATECFNSCFAIRKNNDVFLVDSGGGNGILKQLKQANINLENIRAIFISHNHLDHILGGIWIIRILARKYFKNEIELPISIYGNSSVINTIEKLVELFIPEDFKSIINSKIILETINDSEKIILGNKVNFFDLHATKTLQHGFIFEYEKDKNFCFIGDEVLSPINSKKITNCEYVYADAYMCGAEAEVYNPIKKHHHSTVKYISQIAEKEGVKNLILSHTIDNNLINRKKEFIKDAKLYYNGNIIVPDDLETIIL